MTPSNRELWDALARPVPEAAPKKPSKRALRAKLVEQRRDRRRKRRQAFSAELEARRAKANAGSVVRRRRVA